jgi:hypothetical protein
VWRRKVRLVRGTRWPAESSAGCMVAKTAGQIVGGFLVEPQNEGRAGTTWEPNHEWRLAEATPSSRGLQWFTRKPLGYSVELQNRGRRLNEEVWPPRPVKPARRSGQTAWVGLSAPGGLIARNATAEEL